jgi:signal transduction histidine kinase
MAARKRKPGSVGSSDLRILQEENRRLRNEVEEARARCANLEGELGKILHDGICQDMAAASFYLKCLQNSLERQRWEAVPKIVGQLSDSMQKAMQSTHALSRRLRSRDAQNIPP